MRKLERPLKFLKKNNKINWVPASDVKRRSILLINNLKLNWIKSSKIFFYRSFYAKTEAFARIWGLPRLWQISLKTGPNYIIEVISEKFDKLPDQQKDEVLMHELTHIPRNFSGSLVAHTRKGKSSFKSKLDILQTLYKKHVG